jgi:hypothetical protein
VSLPISSTSRLANALLIPLKWAVVLVAVLVFVVVVPIIELAGDFIGLVQRTFARLL